MAVLPAFALAGTLLASNVVAAPPVREARANSFVGIQPASAVTSITASGGTGNDGHTCALTSAGRVLCWGNNDFGQLGDGSTVRRTSPVNVLGLSGPVIAIAAGGLHTCALTSFGGVECWGINVRGQLGDGTGKDSVSPVGVLGLASGVSAITSGAGQVCALTSAGAVKCWGMNVAGARTDTNDSLAPLDIPDLGSGGKAIAAGLSHTCAVTSGGGVKCWGDGSWGQLGDGKTAEGRIPISETPVDVAGLDRGVVAIAAGDAHTCALTGAGAVKCWGANLANGAEDNSDVPINVPGLDGGIVSVATTYWHTCVLTSLGEVECWGNNDRGQLGDGTTYPSRVPVKARASAGNIAVAAGGYHTCVVTSASHVKCWGANGSGQLGDGTTTDRLSPVDVAGQLEPSSKDLPGTGTTPEVREASGPMSAQAVLVGLLVGLVALLVFLLGPHRRASPPGRG